MFKATTDGNMELKQTHKILNDFSTRHQLINRALDGCKVALDNLNKEDGGRSELRGHYPNELILQFDKQSLIFKSGKTNTPFIRTEIGIYVKSNQSLPLGKYSLDTNLNNEDIDDWLIVD